jgi:hypothetical protein
MAVSGFLYCTTGEKKNGLLLIETSKMPINPNKKGCLETGGLGFLQ